MAGSIKATAPDSQKLAPVTILTTAIAIQICPNVYTIARPNDVFINPLNVLDMPCVNSVI